MGDRTGSVVGASSASASGAGVESGSHGEASSSAGGGSGAGRALLERCFDQFSSARGARQ